MKIAAMPIYGINTLKIFFPGTSGSISTKLGKKHQIFKLIIFCSNDNPGQGQILQLRLLYGKM